MGLKKRMNCVWALHLGSPRCLVHIAFLVPMDCNDVRVLHPSSSLRVVRFLNLSVDCPLLEGSRLYVGDSWPHQAFMDVLA